MRLAQPEAVEQDFVARLEIRVRKFLDGAGKVDPGDHRKLADDRRAPGQYEAVLVVHRRMGHRDGHVAVHQVGRRKLDILDGLNVPILLDEDGPEPALHLGTTRSQLLTTRRPEFRCPVKAMGRAYALGKLDMQPGMPSSCS